VITTLTLNGDKDKLPNAEEDKGCMIIEQDSLLGPDMKEAS